jgi:hypothetical protein
MSRKIVSLGILVCGVAAVAGAQAPEHSGPPPVLSIVREEIKPGRMAAHEKLNVAYVSAMTKTSSQSNWLGLVPISGDDNSTLFLSAFDSFATVEDRRNADEALATNAAFKADMDALDKQGLDLHASQRTMYARYRADLSFHPASTEEVAQSRYFSIITVRVKYSRGPDYVEYLKTVNAAREKANYPVRTAVYQVVTGAPAGTFLIFRALKTLKTFDDDMAAMSGVEKALVEAEGGEEAARKLRLTAADIVQFADPTVYAMNPKISRPAPAFAKYDVAFWTPKPAQIQTAAAVKPGATKQPAAVKQEAPKQ